MKLAMALVACAIVIALLAVISHQRIALSKARSISTECIKQQDEKELISTQQSKNGVDCTYSLNGYGKAKRKRTSQEKTE